MFSKYYYWDDLLPDGLHMKRLEEVPWQGEIWKAAYPQIAEYLSWDPQTEQMYSHYGNISNNVIVNHKPIEINFTWDDPRFKNKMENNVYFEMPSMNDLSYFASVYFPETVENFEPIPFWKIGLFEKNE